MPYRSKIISAGIVVCFTASAAAHAQDVTSPDSRTAAQPQSSKQEESKAKNNDQSTQLQGVVVTGIRERLKKSLD